MPMNLPALPAPTAPGSPGARLARRAAFALALALCLPAPPAGATGDAPAAFQPPPESAIPDNEFGKVVREGMRIFTDTPNAASAFVGNRLTCANCHLDAGRRPDAAPLWAAYVLYPAYRSKNRHVNTLAERLQGCFMYSMNGKAPAANDPVLVALQTYMFWLASGAPTGTRLPGQGYPKLPPPPQKADYLRGQAVYERNCALCHGADGAGQSTAHGHPVFPALWGPDSYNWGAGMHQLGNAAGFIKHNMPLGQAGQLTDQEAWDVAYFMNAHERPQDPRFRGDLEQTRKQYHNGDDSLYGRTVNGRLLGADAPPSGGKLRQEDR